MADALWFHVPDFRLTPLPYPELRHDPLRDLYVLVSTDRAARPADAHVTPVVTSSPLNCPFCVGHEHETPPAVLTYPDDAHGWSLRVVPNRYPALAQVSQVPPGAFALPALSFGVHEVIIDCPQHVRSLGQASVLHTFQTVLAYRDRLRELRSDERLQYAQVFKNVGAEAGASLEHSHSQIIATPFVPPQLARELAAAHTYFEQHRTCVYCQRIGTESHAVARSSHFIAIAPHASRFPCEMWVLPHRHMSQFADLDGAAIVDLGDLLHRLLARLDERLNAPPYNLVLHTAPLHTPDLPHFHWRLEILPRLTGTAGYEWATGCAINPVPPEQAAAYLRL